MSITYKEGSNYTKHIGCLHKYFISIIMPILSIFNMIDQPQPLQQPPLQPIPTQDKQKSIMSRYIACMVLAAVGDAIGYKGGDWQFNYSGPSIHKQLMLVTNDQGIKGLYVNQEQFPYSDDTVMHIATAKALIQSQTQSSLQQICVNLAKHYKNCMKSMSGRAPGATCINSAKKLKKDGTNWDVIPFEKRGGGCGGSMRAACIGLYFHNNLDKLIEVSIESGRITHHNPLGYLGALVAALFTAFSIRGIHPRQWLSLLISTYLPKAKAYVNSSRLAQINLNSGDWQTFETKWLEYSFSRSMKIKVPTDPIFPEVYGVEQREEAYHSFSINGWPGALGVDSVIVAYDALLSSLHHESVCKGRGVEVNRWQQVCLRGMLHGGDSDSTGTIVGAWYGALYGFDQVYQCNYMSMQGKAQLQGLGAQLYDIAYKQGAKQE